MFERAIPYSVLSFVSCLFFVLNVPGALFANNADSNLKQQVKQLKKENLRLKEERDQLQYAKAVMEHTIRASSVSKKERTNRTLDFWWIGLGIFCSTLFMGYAILKKQYKTHNKVVQPLSKMPKPDPNKLTDRELEVLLQLTHFKSNPEIAQNLFISTNTAKTHVANILNKLDASNRQEAVYKAQQLGIISKEKKAAVSVALSLGLGLLFTLSSTTVFAQTKIDNQSDCTFLVKVNLLAQNNCRLNGNGPLIRIQPREQFLLPELPNNSWIAAYGVEEVTHFIDAARIVGNPMCNFRAIIGNYGTCGVTLKFNKQHLTILPK